MCGRGLLFDDKEEDKGGFLKRYTVAFDIVQPNHEF